MSFKDGTSFVTGVIKEKGICCVYSVDDALNATDPDHTFFSIYKKREWLRISDEPLEWSVTSSAWVTLPLKQSVGLGRYGTVYFAGGGDAHEEVVRDGENSIASRGLLCHVRAIDGKAYAVGMDRQVYRRDDANTWTCIDTGCRPKKKGKIVGFMCIDGFNANDIFAAGVGGDLWHSDGTNWTKIDVPTNLILQNIVCAGDGKVYICGQMGLLIVGRGDTWTVIEHGVTEDAFWGIAWFKDKLYLSTMNEVYVWDGNALKPVAWGKDRPDTCYHLTACPDEMWSIGAKDLMAFDGTKWKRIE